MRWFATPLLLLVLALPALPAGAFALPEDGGVSLGEVLHVVAQEFEGRAGVRPVLLLQGALESASAALAPLLVERPEDSADRTLRVRVGARERRFDLAALRGLPQLEPLLAEVRDFIADSLPPAERPAHLDTLLAEGLLRALDAHSALLSAAAYGDFQSKASGRIGGLGMLLVRSEGRLTVEAVLPDSPAEHAGVQAGDRILQIGGQAALELPVEEALGLVRGRVGTRVGLLILRPAEAAPRQLLLRRSDLRFASVSSRVFREGPRERIGYVRVRSFQETTTDELAAHLQRLSVSSPGLLGIVLDLRDNPGGVLEQAIRVADLFLERGTIVTLRGPRIEPEAVAARWYRSISSAPLIVLVNGGTASAAEIVAGALKSNHRALLVGAPTFGKNSIQSVFPLSGGSALKLTVARFYGLDGRSIEGLGIAPHLWLRPVRLAQAPPLAQGLLATAVGGAAERLAAGGEAAQALRELPYLQPAGAAAGNGSAPAAAPDDADFALGVARRLLARNGPQGQLGLMSEALDWAQQERRRQDQLVAQRLAATGVDWSPGAGNDGGQVELLRVALELRREGSAHWEPLAEGAGVPGGARMRLQFTLRNAGALPLHRVLGVLESEAPYLNQRELPVGLLPAGETAQAVLEVTLPAELAQGLEPLRLRIYDGQRRLHYRATVLLPQLQAPQARLRLSLAVFDDGTGGSQGNGDGRAQPGEVLALRVRLHNSGRGPSGTGRYWLSEETGAPLQLLQAWRAFGSLAPGTETADFLRLALGGVHTPVPLALRLNLMSDRLAAQELSWRLPIPLGQPLPRVLLQAPQLELAVPPGPLAQPRVVLRGTTHDERGLRDVVIYRNGRKVHYAATPDGPRDHALRLELPLEPGRNLVRVVARDRDGLTSAREALLWRGQGSGFPIGGRAPGEG
jgi:carboxyl-terminal processing protease